MRIPHDIAKQIKTCPARHGRRIIAIVGAPASGKSTLAQALAHSIEKSCVVPMDGFHLDNEALIERGLLARKGAPQTFGVDGFVSLIRQLRQDKTVPYPTFDRTNDCVVPDGGTVAKKIETVIVEGNYLLLNTPPWDQLADAWDMSVFLNTPIATLRDRLVARWQRYDHSPQQALARAESNDLPNARLVLENSRAADLNITSD